MSGSTLGSASPLRNTTPTTTATHQPPQPATIPTITPSTTKQARFWSTGLAISACGGATTTGCSTCFLRTSATLTRFEAGGAVRLELVGNGRLVHVQEGVDRPPRHDVPRMDEIGLSRGCLRHHILFHRWQLVAVSV